MPGTPDSLQSNPDSVEPPSRNTLWPDEDEMVADALASAAQRAVEGVSDKRGDDRF